MNERTQTLYQHVLRGLSEECSQIEALDERFITFVSDVRRIEHDAIAGTLPQDWEHDWNRIGTLLAEIHGHAANARKRLEAVVVPESDPLAEWTPVAAIDDEIEALLAKRKAAATALVSREMQGDWEVGWLALEAHFATLRAHARSLQVKLELQRRFGKQKAAEIAAELAAKLPADLRNAEGVEALHKADEQLQEDRQHFHGIWDVVKALALWVETPEERARHIRKEK
jgi:hypothetical protein